MSRLSFHMLTQIIKKTQKSDQDAIFAITGPTGIGKSVLSVWLHLKHNKGFNFLKDMALSREQVLKALDNRKQFGNLSIDEAINVLFKRDHMQRGQKEILRVFDMIRKMNLFVTMQWPFFWALDKHILDSGRIRLWFYVDKRGHAYIFAPDKNPFTQDPWHRTFNEKVLKNWNQGIHPEKARGYIGEIYFPDLPPDIKAKYLEAYNRLKVGAERYENPKDKQKRLKLEEKEIAKVEASILASLKEKLPRGFIKQYARDKGIHPNTLYDRIKAVQYETRHTDDILSVERNGLKPHPKTD